MPLRLDATLARGTVPRRDSRISLEVRLLRLILFAGTERFLMSRPLIVSAAYELPPSAINTAIVAITLA